MSSYFVTLKLPRTIKGNVFIYLPGVWMFDCVGMCVKTNWSKRNFSFKSGRGNVG